jgi:hypothetical protein
VNSEKKGGQTVGRFCQRDAGAEKRCRAPGPAATLVDGILSSIAQIYPPYRVHVSTSAASRPEINAADPIQDQIKNTSGAAHIDPDDGRLRDTYNWLTDSTRDVTG